MAGISHELRSPLASRIDLGSVPLQLGTLELANVCGEAWNRVADRASAQGTELDLQCADGAHRVRADGALVVRRAVEVHGGRVEARSAVPHGLEILFDLPAAD